MKTKENVEENECRQYPVNKGGFPLAKEHWDELFTIAEKLNSEDAALINQLRNYSTQLHRLPISVSIKNILKLTPKEKLIALQAYINQLEYNFIGTQFFPIHKNKCLLTLESTAENIIKDSLPIKCLEAVILAIYLTKGCLDLQRFTIAFKTEFNGLKYRHVVLGIYADNKFGALGISRRSDLMYKPLIYSSLSQLIHNYVQAYERYFHTVLRIKIGLMITHEPRVLQGIPWKGVVLCPSRYRTHKDLNEVIEKYSKIFRNSNCAGQLPTQNNPSELITRYLMRSTVLERCGPPGDERIKIRVRSSLGGRRCRLSTNHLPPTHTSAKLSTNFGVSNDVAEQLPGRLRSRTILPPSLPGYQNRLVKRARVAVNNSITGRRGSGGASGDYSILPIMPKQAKQNNTPVKDSGDDCLVKISRTNSVSGFGSEDMSRKLLVNAVISKAPLPTSYKLRV